MRHKGLILKYSNSTTCLHEGISPLAHIFAVLWEFIDSLLLMLGLNSGCNKFVKKSYLKDVKYYFLNVSMKNIGDKQKK